MVESSKILTVSYGTFSCTLEGFDDSFSTMKAIAEYFRDLAQGDRYFGAEPPAPDAEMLTRIAEKEIARRVEARADESGIVLRATNTAQSAPMVAPVMPPVATPPAPEAVADAASAVEDAPAVEEIAETEEIAESSPAATADVEEDVAGPEAEDDMSSTLVASSPAAPVAEDVMDNLTEEMDITAPATSFADMDASTISEVPAHPDADSVAAKLQRIRAVVTKRVETEDVQVETDEAETAEIEDVSFDDIDAFDDIDTPTDTFDNEIAADEMPDVSDTEDAAVQDTDEDIATYDDADVDDVADDVSTEVEAENVTEPQADVAEEDGNDVEEQKPPQNFRARILRVAKKPAAAAAIEAATNDTADDTVAKVADEISSDEAIADIADDVAIEDTAEESIFDDIDEVEVADLVAEDAAIDNSLSEEDEAALLADLAEVEQEEVADIASDIAETDAPEFEAELEAVAEDFADDAATESEALAEDTAETPSGRDILPEADDAAMSRIMDQADQQLSEPAGSRRRSAIAQLKAAVAATEAARQLGDKGDDAAAKENAFRDDLNEAVRPRPASELPRTEARTERPRTRPAPLKLVASQRVDEEGAEAEDVAAEQPKRSAADKTETRSFADFAADMGATELPDLLEAAAAYTAFVEGVEDFSRPQIMKKVQASAAEEFSREDGLRSFGTLLRQGRISKVRNGRFQISDQTRFKPEKKAG